MDQYVRLALNKILSAPEFRDLQTRIDDVGILEVLGIHRREIYHTKALAWLLNPEAEHGMGADLLKSFLHMVWRNIGNKLGSDIGQIPDPTRIEGVQLDSAVTTAEHTIETGRRLDVVTFYADEDGKDRPLLVVEYKIDAGEQDRQTSDYADWAAARAGDIAPFLVYLAPGSAAPQDDRFRSLSFEAYRDWLEELQWHAGSTRRMDSVANALLDAVDSILDPQPPEAAELQSLFAPEITTLAKYAQSEESTEFSAALDRFAAPLRALGIERKGRRKYGASEFIVKVTELLEPADSEPLLSPETWRRTSGNAQLCYYSRKVFQRVTQTWPSGSEVFWLAIWIDRPWSEKTEVRLGIGSSFPKAAKSDADKAITSGIRKHIDNNSWHGKEGTLTVARMTVSVPGVRGPEDDTPDLAEKALQASGEAIRSFVQSVADATDAWLKGADLDALLAEAAAKAPDQTMA
ncbi:MAG: PD-(D/E)XK nuclease family protein [Planctomycetes bacterium]|nr:PD-(D/E)XK nuclease family protein [Planctomycetota bacterium]